jgi:RNA polymerase sigma factor (sigma-70 family)
MTAEDYNDCVSKNADSLYRFMLKCTRNPADAQDLVQSAFERLWAKRKEVDPATAKSYLFTIGWHRMIDEGKKSKRMEYRDALPDQAETARERPGLRQLLESALDRLPEQQRALVMLKDYEGYSYDEIGRITGLNAGQVKVTLHRARLRLKEYLISVEHVL